LGDTGRWTGGLQKPLNYAVGHKRFVEHSHHVRKIEIDIQAFGCNGPGVDFRKPINGNQWFVARLNLSLFEQSFFALNFFSMLIRSDRYRSRFWN